MTKLQALLDESNAAANGSVAYLAGNLIEEAEDNANQTAFIEKAVPVEERDRMAEASLVDLLAYCKEPEILAWFAQRGIVA
jgi:hypothetical protein